MNKYKISMTGILYSLSIVAASLFGTSCNDDNNDKPFVPGYEVAPAFTSEDATKAYDSFNEHLLDPVRKIYYRDTNKPQAVGAIWTQAIYWDMSMNAYTRTQDAKYLQLIEDLYQGNYDYYDHYNWDNAAVWFIYDDIMWWVISMVRAYEVTGDKKYLDLSKSGFHRVWYGSPVVGDLGSYDTEDGGMFWDWTHGRAGKMSCINYPTVIAAAMLYNATKNTDYLDKAKEIYEWSYNNLFDKKGGAVADSKHGNNVPTWKMHVYNQATCIGSAMMLYNITKEEHYLEDATLAADYTFNTMSGKLQILPFEGGEEQGIYTAIFAQYIMLLVEDGNKPEYLPWLYRTINYGWALRDETRNLTSKDYSKKLQSTDAVSCYDASGIPALMQMCPPKASN